MSTGASWTDAAARAEDNCPPHCPPRPRQAAARLANRRLAGLLRWAQTDSNRRLLACKASALTKLSYTPVRADDCTFGVMSDPVADSPSNSSTATCQRPLSWPRRSRPASGHRSTWSPRLWNGPRRCSRASTASPRSGLTKQCRGGTCGAGGRRRAPLGVLHGVPVAIKDTSPAAGHLTTFGSYAFAEYVPDHDAYVVAALRRAGAIIIGQTTTPEFAHTLRTDSPLLGRHPQPAPPRSHAGRIVGRQRGGRRIRLRAPRRGQRHGRLGAHPGGVVRDRRPQAGARADPDGRPARPVRHDLPPRTARPLRGRRPSVPRRDPGPRRRRHPLGPRPARPRRAARRRRRRPAPGALRRPRVLGRRPGHRRCGHGGGGAAGGGRC